jgi:hypothetical protein
MSRRAALAAVVAAMALCACGTTQSPAQAVRSWSSTNEFPTAMDDLLNDSATVASAITAHKSSDAVYTDCAELFTDANGINTGLLPTPDTQLTNLLSTTVDEYIHLAAQCDDSPGSATVLTQVLAERARAFGDLVDTVLRYEDVAGRPAGVKGIP